MSDATGATSFRPSAGDFLENPYPTYARLRRETPIFYHEPWRKWILTRHADIDALLRDRRLGRVIHHLLAPEELPSQDPEHGPFRAIQEGSLLEIEPPDHTRIRSVVHSAFTPRHVRALQARIEALCETLADRLAVVPERRADLIQVFAEPLPVTVIAELLGIPEPDRHRLLPWSKAIIGMFEPERTAADEREAVRAAGEFSDYLRWLVPRKRLEPADDLVTRMVEVHDQDPDRLSESEIVANCILFLDAGHEAVVNVIGNGMKALLSHPAELDRLREDRELVATAVEEMMRFDTPLQFFERFALEDMEYQSHQWPKGTKLCLYYASANHDERVFESPERFDVGRDPNPHLAFGMGLHYCIGAPLARLELSVALRTLLRRFPDLRLAQQEFRYLPKNVFRYLTELRVEY
ncbi:MAG: cytochrome P450 [Trueperaceae bacterium]